MKKLLTLSLLFAMTLLLPSQALPAPWQRLPPSALPNLLENPGCEEGVYEWNGIGEVKVCKSWQPWWDARSTRPEFKPAERAVDARRVRSGDLAQQWFNNYATHTGGIYQRVENVPFSATLSFMAWLQAFSSNKDDFDKSDGRYRMRIGIDPYGGVDPESPDVVWSKSGHAIQPYDEYVFLSVDTTAKSDRATVFIWGQAEWALKHNNAYVDDAALYAVVPTPTPGTCTPAPTYTPYPTYTPAPCPTCVPGGGCSCESVRSVVETVVAEREPVRWPR